MTTLHGRKPFGGLLAACTLAIPLAMTGAPALAASGWFSTATRAFDFQTLPALSEVDARAPLHIVLGLKLRDGDALKTQLHHITTRGDAEFGHTLSGVDFTARYAPTTGQTQAVVDYLRSAGFSNIVVTPNRLLVSADANAAIVQRAFNTRLAQFQRDGETVRVNLRDAQVPAALAGTVLAVHGLQNAETARTFIQPAKLGTDATTTSAVGHVSTEFPALYDAILTPTASTLSVGISTWGDMSQALIDTAAFEATHGLPQYPIEVRKAGADGTDTSGTPEWDLDAQDIIGMSGGIKSIILYTATSSSNGDLLQSMNLAVTDNLVYAINASWGACERGSDSSGFLATADQIFEQAVAQGQTFFFASGDGASRTGCYTHKGLLVEPSYPATSPYVASVGGTTLNTNSDGSYANETAWKSSGGGYSAYETAPLWQSTAINVCGGRQGACGRAIPDIAMDADPNSGSIIIANGKSAQYGGTSLAAPLATAAWLRFAAYAGPPGFASPQLYYAANLKDVPYVVYHDVTSGSNGAYKAGTGWDAVTGLGTWDVDALYKDLVSLK